MSINYSKLTVTSFLSTISLSEVRNIKQIHHFLTLCFISLRFLHTVLYQFSQLNTPIIYFET
ncbi:hypothetical protein HanIR_Chr13g0649271 [Helianthus annuus]|nr:hypothetical protein HanIR_Chr13g0649271 [Helianthus annuus]